MKPIGPMALRGVLPVEQCAALADAFSKCRLEREPSGRLYAAVPALDHLAVSVLKPKVEELCDMPVAAVNGRVACYESGADLPAHCDQLGRQAFAVMSIVLAARPGDPRDWPLCFRPSIGLQMEVGDGALYDSAVVHWRPRMPRTLDAFVIAVVQFMPRRAHG